MNGIAAALLAVGATSATAQGSDATLARNLAAGCAGCHGTGGIAQGSVPSLAGQSKDEIVRKMNAYRDGSLQGTLMPQLAKGYTPQQVELIAGWYAAQKGR